VATREGRNESATVGASEDSDGETVENESDFDGTPVGETQGITEGLLVFFVTGMPDGCERAGANVGNGGGVALSAGKGVEGGAATERDGEVEGLSVSVTGGELSRDPLEELVELLTSDFVKPAATTIKTTAPTNKAILRTMTPLSHGFASAIQVGRQPDAPPGLSSEAAFTCSACDPFISPIVVPIGSTGASPAPTMRMALGATAAPP
jgi:hypothetical protein